MREFHLRDAFASRLELLPEELQFSRPARAFSHHDALTSQAIGGSRLSNDQVGEFAEAFFAHAGRDADQPRLSQFLAQTSTITDIRSNPLLLGVLCNLYVSGRTMPRNRSELYSKCAQMLFEEWDAGKGLIEQADNQYAAESAIRELALDLFTEGREEIAEFELLEYLREIGQRDLGASLPEAEHFALNTLKSWRGRRWLLVFIGTKGGVDYFRFAHRTFLEFFAARQTVFECRDGRELATRLAEMVRERTATNYCWLALQLMSQRTRNSSDEFFETLLAPSIESDPRSDLNVALFSSGALASTVIETTTRRMIVELSVDVFARLLPANSDRTASGHRTFESVDVLDGSVVFDSDLENESEDLDARAMTLGQISVLLGAVEHLGAVDQVGAGELLFQKFRAGIESEDPARWVLFAMALRELPLFTNWRNIDPRWTTLVRDTGESCWRELHNAEVQEWDLSEADPSIVIALLRSGLGDGERLIRGLHKRDLFTHGSPFPVDNVRVYSLAHLLFLSFLGLKHPSLEDTLPLATVHTWAGAVIGKLFSDQRSVSLYGSEPLNDLDLIDWSNFSVPTCPTCRVAVLMLARMLARHGDSNLLDLIPRNVRAGQGSGSVTTLISLAAWNGDWQGDEAEIEFQTAIDDPALVERIQEWAIGNSD